MLRRLGLGAVLAVAACEPGVAQVVVQQPEFQQFAAPATVLLPDRGEAFLGGTRGGIQSRDLRGPVPLGSTRAGGSSASSMTVRVYVHDMRAMDEALLRGDDADAVRPGLARPAPAAAAPPVAQAPRGGWLRRMPPRR